MLDISQPTCYTCYVSLKGILYYGKRDIGSTDRVVCYTIILLHGIRNYTLYKEKVMAKIYRLKATPRRHGGRMDNEVQVSGIQNKIRNLDKTECLNISVFGNDLLQVNYQIPVYMLHHTERLFLRPWTAQIAGATSLSNVQLNTKGKWNQYMTVDRIDPNKRVELPSLEHLFSTDERFSYKENNRAERIRNQRLDPLED
jgi:hypothetical protein